MPMSAEESEQVLACLKHVCVDLQTCVTQMNKNDSTKSLESVKTKLLCLTEDLKIVMDALRTSGMDVSG